MCFQLINDIKTAIWNPPRSPLEKEILYARLRAYSVRIQYVIWNIGATVLLYLFSDSLLNDYISHQIYLAILFHFIQIISICAYFITSLINPSYVDYIKPGDIDQINNNQINNNQINKYLDANINFSLFNINFKKMNSDATTTQTTNINDYPYRIISSIPEHNQHILIDPDFAPSNYCWRCEFIRPIRSKHCFDCDRCVAKFDHHCPMVGNCVAANNHRYFVLFLFTETIIVLWTFYMSLNTLFQMDRLYNNENQKDYGERGVFGWLFRILFFIALFFAVFVVVGLCGFHIYLGFSNQTTYEMIKPQIIENYIRDEIKRKRKYIRKKENKKKKKLKKKEKNLLKKKHNNLQKKIDRIKNKKNNINNINDPDEKYNNNNDNDDDDSDDDSSDDDDDTSISDDELSSSVSEQLLSSEIQNNQNNKPFKRSGTPIPRKNQKKYQKYKNNYRYRVDEYRNYFDEGFINNSKLFFSAKIHPEWKTAIPCTIISKPQNKIPKPIAIPVDNNNNNNKNENQITQ